MKKLVILVLFMFLLVSPIAFAQEFTMGLTKDNQYLAGRTGIVDLTITNNGPKDIYSISVIGTPSGWLTAEESAIELSRDTTESLKIYVSPAKDASPKLYEYFVTIRSVNTDERIEKQLILNIQQNASIIVTDTVLTCTSCREDVKISGYVENAGTVDFTSVDLLLDLEGEEIIFPVEELKINAKKPFEELFSLDGYRPGSYDINFKVVANEKTVYNDVKQFAIPTIQNIEYESKSSKTIFGNFVTIMAENKGNDLDVAVFEGTIDNSWYTFYAGPEQTEGKWTLDVDAGQSIKLKYSEIYWPIYLFIIIVVLGGFFLYMKYTSLVIRKAIPGKNIAVKGKSMSVSITIKNRVREMTNVVVKDVVPKEFEVSSRFETIKPVMRKTTDGTELTWKLGRLKAHEQRVLHYKIRPKSTLKRMNLPGATITTKYFNKIIMKMSNYVAIYSKENTPSSLAVEISE